MNNYTSGKAIRSLRWLEVLALLCVVAVGLELRLQAALETVVDQPLRADAGDYFVYAYNLKNHGVFSRSRESLHDLEARPAPDALRSPGYPLFLALFIDGPMTESAYQRILIAQALMGSLVVLMTFFVFRSFLSPASALCASLLTALSPHLINAGVYILTETLFSCLLVGAVWILTRLGGKHENLALTFCGVAISGAALVRPSLQYFIPVLPAFAFFFFGGRRGGRTAAVLLLSAGLIYAPWLVRNYSTLGRLGDSSLAITTLQLGMYPNLQYRDDPRSFGYPYRFDPRSREISESYDSVVAEIGRRFSEEPARHLRWYLLDKPFVFWSWDIIAGQGDSFIYPALESPYYDSWHFRVSRDLMKALHWPVVILGMLGALFVWVPRLTRRYDDKQRFIAGVVSLILLYFTALHTIGAPLPRYAVPIRPFVYGLAIFSLEVLVQLIESIRLRHSAPKRHADDGD